MTNESTLNNPYQMGTGYTQNSNPPIAMGDIQAYASQTVSLTSKTWVPATPDIPGTPAVPPTSGQIDLITNKGWNTWARSVSPLSLGHYLDATVQTGANGVLLGIAPAGAEGIPISQFTHAVLCDLAGVHVYENGVVVKTLLANNMAAVHIRIFRQSDGTIVYVVISGATTAVYTSATSMTTLTDLFVYGMLYVSGDTILSNVFAAGTVSYGSF